MIKDFILKIDIVLLLGILASLIPLWNQLDKILTGVREEAKAMTEIKNQLDFYGQRLDRIEDFISKNSGLRL